MGTVDAVAGGALLSTAGLYFGGEALYHGAGLLYHGSQATYLTGRAGYDYLRSNDQAQSEWEQAKGEWGKTAYELGETLKNGIGLLAVYSVANAWRPRCQLTWQEYEQKYGATKTQEYVTVNGKTMTIYPDKVVDGVTIDFKNYDFSRPFYDTEFGQSVIKNQFRQQAEKYLATGRPLVFQFSQQPPEWLAEFIRSLGATYTVKP